MKKSWLAVLLVFAIALCGCGQTADEGNDNPSSTQGAWQVTDLGLCADAVAANARMPWDLVVSDGKLYVGIGDYTTNSGPTSIRCYDETTKEWSSSATVRQEAIARFVRLDGRVIALGTDPMDGGAADCYLLKDDSWGIFSSISGALHVFDAETHGGSIYYGIGCENGRSAVVKQDIATGEWTDVALMKGGVSYITALEKMENVQGKRVYDLFSVNGKLFCVFSCAYTTGKTTMEFFELSGDAFVFRQALVNTDLKINKPVKNQVLFNADAVYENSCYLSLGGLYKTDDFVRFDKIDVPNNGCVTDLLVDGTDFYILSTVQDGEMHQNVIYKMTDGKLTKVFAFDSATAALSFVKCADGFYVGLGGAVFAHADNGRILKITYSA